MRLPDGHLARIPHGAVMRRRPSGRRIPLYFFELHKSYIYFQKKKISKKVSPLWKYLVWNFISSLFFHFFIWVVIFTVTRPRFSLSIFSLPQRSSTSPASIRYIWDRGLLKYPRFNFGSSVRKETFNITDFKFNNTTTKIENFHIRRECFWKFENHKNIPKK